MKHISQLMICSAALLLDSCVLQQQLQQTADPATEEGAGSGAENTTGGKAAKPEGGRDADGDAAPVPTAAQQAAAHDMLNTPSAPAGVLVEPTGYTVDTTPAGVPGGRGIRMGTMAPPEEAASSSEAAPLRPNAAERRGLRTPPMPKGLPMDMNGKLNPEASN